MKRLRYQAVALFLVFSLMLNIERFDLGLGRDFINLQSFVYVLSTLSILATLLIPLALKVPAYVWLGGWGVFYTLLKFLYSSQRPIIGGINTYLTITEFALLMTCTALAYRFSLSLQDLEGTIANLILPGVGQRVRPLEDAREDIQKEFTRSRRSQNLMSLLVLQPDCVSLDANIHQTAQDIMKKLVTRYASISLIQSVARELRRTDMILEQQDQNRFVILLPDTSPEHTSILTERIQAIAQDDLGISIACASASFPDQALTFEGLLHSAEANFNRTETAPEMQFTHQENQNGTNNRFDGDQQRS